MSSRSPAFVLVPGHWHTTTHMQPLATNLQQKGFSVKAVRLHSVGIKTPRPTFADDVNVIYNAVSAELRAGTDVCLVLHSYAGMPGAEAINKLLADGALNPGDRKGKLVKAVFIAAYTFPAGFIMDARDFIRPDDPGFSIDENEMTHMADPAHFFFNDLSPEAARPWIDALDDTYYLRRGPVISSDDWRKAPITALLCKQDNAVPPERQEMVWQGMESEWIDASHTPYVSQPAKVAEILLRLARG